MKVSNIFEGLKSGKFDLEECGHSFWGSKDRHKKYLIERYEQTVEDAKGANDGKWEARDGKTKEEINESMRKHYQMYLDVEPRKNGILYLGFTDGEKCCKCGRRYKISFDGSNLITNVYFDSSADTGRRFKGDFVLDKNRCSYEVIKPTTGKIKITNSIVVTNLFREIEDCPEKLKYTEGYSLNSYAGTANITKYKAEKNVAYGQMSNTSIRVYINSAKDSIIIGSCYHPAESQENLSYEEYKEAISKPAFDGYKKLGDICLDVWRWEATDYETIKPHFKQIEEYSRYRGLIKRKVKPGICEFNHYYDAYRFNGSDKEDPIYATINWISK